jgi:hypothetical protein
MWHILNRLLCRLNCSRIEKHSSSNSSRFCLINSLRPSSFDMGKAGRHNSSRALTFERMSSGRRNRNGSQDAAVNDFGSLHSPSRHGSHGGITSVSDAEDVSIGNSAGLNRLDEVPPPLSNRYSKVCRSAGLQEAILWAGFFKLCLGISEIQLLGFQASSYPS